MPKPQTNVQFVKNLMEHSQYGALAQLFILDALDKWSEQVSKADPKDVDTAMISGHAWVGVAKEIQDKLKARLG